MAADRVMVGFLGKDEQARARKTDRNTDRPDRVDGFQPHRHGDDISQDRRDQNHDSRKTGRHMADHEDERHIGNVNSDQTNHQVIGNRAACQRNADAARQTDGPEQQPRKKGLPEHHRSGDRSLVTRTLEKVGLAPQSAPSPSSMTSGSQRKPVRISVLLLIGVSAFFTRRGQDGPRRYSLICWNSVAQRHPDTQQTFGQNMDHGFTTLHEPVL